MNPIPSHPIPSTSTTCLYSPPYKFLSFLSFLLTVEINPQFSLRNFPQTPSSSLFQTHRMLLKSSSTPLLGSLLSVSETTPKSNEQPTKKHLPSSPFHSNRLSFSTSLFSSNSSPSIAADFSDRDRFSCRGFRRAQSEGNLNTLAHVSDSLEDPFFVVDSYKPKKFTDRPKHLMLQTIPSFSLYDSRGRTEEEEEEEEDTTDVEEEEDWLEENKEIWANDLKEETGVKDSEGNCFDINSKMKGVMSLTSQITLPVKDETWSRTSFQQETEFTSKKMHLARGLGIDGIGGIEGGGSGGRGEINSGGRSGNGGDKHGDGMEEYYKNMVVENPGNPLVLRNYAKFLYQSKGDLQGAEEFYSRAILIDSKDGEILSQYAKLVWELHRDYERASAYFQRAVQASPQDSHVHAAYANFLWETEDEYEEAEEIGNFNRVPHLDQSYTAAATA